MKFYKNGLTKLSYFLLSLLLSSYSYASGVTPYLPTNISQQLDSDLEKLALYTNIPQLIKPYSVATVLNHLKQIKSSHPSLHKRLEKSLKPYDRKLGLSHARISVATKYSDNETVFQLPNQMGSTSEQEYRLKLHGHWQETPWLGIYAGFDTSSERTVPSGSILALGTSWAQLDIGYKERWWSPFQGNAQMISTNAETLPSIGLSNNTPIEFFGTTFNYDFFLAQTSRQPILYRGELSDKSKPYFSGMHFSFQPTEWWSIGVNRMFQFGGGERDTGLKDILRAIVDPRGADNDASNDQQAGNQIASIVSRINFDSFSVYMEYAGEDTSNNKEWQLGNSAVNAGIFFPGLLKNRISFSTEYSEWQNGWYSHHLYREGLTHKSVILGHAGHVPSISSGNHSVSGTNAFFKLNYTSKSNKLSSLTVRNTKPDNSVNEEFLTVKLTTEIQTHSLKFEVTIGTQEHLTEGTSTYLEFTLARI